MNYAYIRISKDTQDAENQRYEILNYSNTKNLGKVEILDETISSRKRLKEREIEAFIEPLQKGDRFIVTEYSRMGRDLFEIMTLLHKLIEKKIEIHITKKDMIMGNDIQSKVMAMAFAIASEIERDLISSRTKQALARKKAEGVILGRPKGSTSKSKLDDKEALIKDYLSKGVSKNSLAKILSCAPSTLNNFIRSRNIHIFKVTNESN